MTSVLQNIAREIAPDGLIVMGALHPAQDWGTVVLLGAGPDFWPAFRAAPEYEDGERDPIDRWSMRVIESLATAQGAQAIFPFHGPPYAPFIAWAKDSGRAWPSPTGMLVHDISGLMISYRGALGFRERLEIPPASGRSPCDSCADRPCVDACPVGALSAHSAYDVPACHGYLDIPAGAGCMSHGCAVRRACPISESFGRDPAQSALHMKAFHPK